MYSSKLIFEKKYFLQNVHDFNRCAVVILKETIEKICEHKTNNRKARRRMDKPPENTTPMPLILNIEFNYQA